MSPAQAYVALAWLAVGLVAGVACAAWVVRRLWP